MKSHLNNRDKKKILFRLWFWACTLTVIGPTLGSYPSLALEVKDVTQTRVKVSDTPRRIITLLPSLGELAADLLGEDIGKLVGVSNFTDYPPSLKNLPEIGPYHQVNLEKIISLKPDLILASLDGNSKDQIRNLQEAKIPVVLVNTENFKQIEDSIRIVSLALGKKNQGEQMISQLNTGISHLKKRAASRKPVQVLVQIWNNPLVVAGKTSFLNDAVTTVGAENVYGKLDVHYPRPSLEDVLAKNPEAIVIIALGNNSKEFENAAKSWSQFPNLKAVQNRRVYVLKSDALVRPTLRILEGLSQLEKILYAAKE